MRFASLGSGSKGNATLVEAKGTRVLVDCGYSAKELERRMEARNLSVADIEAILVTHEHGDHIKGVSVLSRRHKLPVYSTRGTWLACQDVRFYDHHTFSCQNAFRVGDLDIFPFAVPHDAREPCQFRISDGSASLGLLTDLGSISQHVLDSARGCDALMLEFNYDPKMLAAGPYPLSLQRRIDGAWGHLSNQQATELLKVVDRSKLRFLIAMHLSEKNNDEKLAAAALAEGVGDSSIDTRVASQTEGFDWISL